MKRLLKRYLQHHSLQWGRCLALLLAAALFSGSLLAANHTVRVSALTFDPQVLTINVGDTVDWRPPSVTTGNHNVVEDDGSFSSGNPVYKVVYSHTFNSAGDFPYHCTGTDGSNYPGASRHKGRIVVQAASPPIQINAGMNDTWRNKDTHGQGFFISVFPDTSPDRPEPVMFVGWFTYDLERPPADVTAVLGEPGHRWLTANGPYSGNIATLDIELTQGGIFDSGIPAPAQTPGYGSMTVQFTSCSAGVVTYDIPSVGVSGTVPIERVANDNVALCESLQTP